MRVALPLVACALALGACSRNDAEGRAGGSPRIAASDQAKYDAERKPEEVVRALGLRPGSRVADIGAGTGLLTVHLARAVAPNGKVVATDIDAQLLDLLQQRLAAEGLDGVVERRVVAADRPELEPGIYDAILLAEVDNYFSDPVGWLKAAIPALRPGGRIVISNRIYRRTNSLAAARKAGLVLVAESTPVPSHFIAVFQPGETK